MKTTEAIRWFKTTFHQELSAATAGTPFTVDLLTAIAQQETGYIWSILVDKGRPLDEVIRLCVGDTIDAKYVDGKNKGRNEFPRNKQELIDYPQGDRMFDIARQCLIDMAKHVPGYQSAVNNKSKFCHGFGIFQYDLQFFKPNPSYFLQKKWESFPTASQWRFGSSRKPCSGRAGETSPAYPRMKWFMSPSLTTEGRRT